MAGGDSKEGIYDHLYARFYEDRHRHEGYDFQHAPGGSIRPSTVKFSEKLKWWSWDRWRRRKQILAERDRRQREILELKPHRES
jgi:hypothetical protein